MRELKPFSGYRIPESMLIEWIDALKAPGYLESLSPVAQREQTLRLMVFELELERQRLEKRTMRVAVLTLTRDRADYTRHCFEMLKQNAGIPFDHYVLDQASEDDTVDYLYDYDPLGLILMDENVGIHRGWNLLLDEAAFGEYDVLVTMDNDCEMTEHGTLKAVCDAVHPYSGWIASPWVNGLQNPLTPAGEYLANGLRIGQTPHIGGICRAMPGEFVRNGFRFDEAQPIWGGDEGHITRAFLPGHVGWLLDWSVNHYKTTDGQQAEQGEYFDRKFREMGLR